MPATPIFFDHIEVHVSDISRYCEFLIRLFNGGRWKVISDSGTAMFCSLDGINIEVKKRTVEARPVASGFCNPCLRMENAKSHIEKTLQLKIENTVSNPDGVCYFFFDDEDVLWHIKDYLVQDQYINW